MTELHVAAERGDVREIRRLLSTSLNINSRDVSDNRPELHATWFITTQEGDSAIFLAALRGHVAVVKLLIEAGAMVNLQDKVWQKILLQVKTNTSVFKIIAVTNIMYGSDTI